MTAKSKKKPYDINRRFDAFLCMRIEAESFEQAVEEAKKLHLGHFINAIAANDEGASIIDDSHLPGFGVYEAWNE